MLRFFTKKPEVITQKEAVNELITRSVENIFPNREAFSERLLQGKPVSIYLGIDPTGPTLHLGHAVSLRKLREFQKMGHNVTLLIGDFTATIGDPTDKAATRKKLTRAEVLKNCTEYKKQASRYLNFGGSNPARLVFNSKWLAKLNFADVLELSSLVTVDQMLKRDMFAQRQADNKPIHIHEFMYPLMQGYDSVALETDAEIGGNDQTFNMLMGRDLLKSLKNKEKFVIAVKLLTDPSGKKMGKTENNAVALNQTPEDIFGRVMSWGDEIIIQAMELCTDMTADQIKSVENELKNGENPRNAKVKLAYEVVKGIHSQEDADRAQQVFEKTFSKKEMPEDAAEIIVAPNTTLLNCLIDNNLVPSKGEFRRLAESGAFHDVDDEAATVGADYVFTKNINLRIGKKKFIKITVA